MYVSLSVAMQLFSYVSCLFKLPVCPVRGAGVCVAGHLEVLWGFKGHQVRQELQQEHQRLLTGCMIATAASERHL